ncbi:hypothetical protein N825_21595 [Skermanella stibiiresistens SB22]|uniref:FlgN protein n=1 Tax=Skermanella stibiiresistens SB22 TaxID=1385369 RepID=W9GTU6_9PROT|nr:flagellar protein FlgN [Skermanella stibiiresistens]EWY37184.1 hypothetical protein N825_21595 [Skermanella stibiiresistens SB22]
MDATTAVNETCETMESYTALLERETEAVRASKLEEVAKLGDAKTSLSRKLDHQIMVLRHNKPIIAALDAALRRRLEQLWVRLSAAAEANLKALRNAEMATKQVIDMVVDVTKQTRAEHCVVGYGRPSARYPTGRPPQALSVAVNTTL